MKTRSQTSSRNALFRLHTIVLGIALLGYLAASLLSPSAAAQVATAEPTANAIRIGERLTYNVSMGPFSDSAYAELYAVSRGRLGDRDAIELRAKFKTLDLASAAFYLIDETRTTFVSPANGLPLHTSVIQNAAAVPKETSHSFLAVPTPHVDLLTMIYRLRQMGGSGSLTMQENDRVYSVVFQSAAIERQKTDAGEFETSVVSIQSEYFTELGITDVRVNLSTDEARLPVLVRFRTGKGAVRARLASVQNIEPEISVQPTPAPVRTPLPERTPKPPATPAPYVDNLPLAPELAFELGESLQYRIASNNQPVARMTLAARERKLFNGADSLLLEAIFSDIRPGAPFAAGDFVRAYVDPDTLAPRHIEMRFAGALRAFSRTAKFDEGGSVITTGDAGRIDAPVGTHSILSLLYAARSFNLKPSRDLNNPINDTRVAVLWESQPYIFTLRPSPPEVLTVDGKQLAAQLVSVSTKNSVLDQLNIRMWLGNDASRVPLRFMIGAYQIDLISASKVQAK